MGTVYVDYTSVVSRTHILRRTELIAEVLQSPDWERFVDTYNDHFFPYLGELGRYITGEVANYQWRLFRGAPTTTQGQRMQREMDYWSKLPKQKPR